MNFISNRTQINKLKRVMKRAAMISGKHLMKAYKRKKVNITEKSKKEWVTETDLAVEKIIIKELIKDYPGSNFIAEESGTNISDPEQITWIIDPIDGTNNFITKYPYFCINIIKLKNNFLNNKKFLEAFNKPGPNVFLVPIDPLQTYFPKITSRVTKEGSMESNPIHNMSPEITEDEKKKFLKFV